MDVILGWIVDFFKTDRGELVIQALVILIVGLVVARMIRGTLRRLMSRSMSPDHAAVVSRLAYSLLVVLVLLLSARQLGLDMGVLLGAAGILTVALGFASQTSASNLISGLFLLGERPFVVGDVIKVDTTTGEVVSIDLLSIKLRTFDNLFVRVPNEKLLKSEITTLTRYPIRRLDLVLRVSYQEDLGRVRRVLQEVAEGNPLCLDEPTPVMIFKEFEESAQKVQFSVWAVREKWFELHNTLPEEIKGAFDKEGVVIPYPQRTVHLSGEIQSMEEPPSEVGGGA